MEGTPFGRYTLVELLGRGGMGDVWRAYDTVTDRVVAVKVLPAHLASDQTFQERFRREARAAAGLNNPHVVPIHDFGEIDGRLFVDMRLIEGEDLGTLLAAGPLAPQRAIRIVGQIALALFAAHRIGLVHRDVKPSNILVTEDDFAYLIDFGIARAEGEAGLTDTNAAVGTWAYMAPERFSSGSADARADVYALTCVLYEALTGQSPFPGRTLEQIATAHMLQPPPKPSALLPQIPPAMDRVISTGMAKEPEQRYASTKDLASAARAAIGREQDRTVAAHQDRTMAAAPVPPTQQINTPAATQYRTPMPSTSTPPTPSAPADPPSGRRRNILLASAAALLVVIVAVVAVIMFTGGSDSPSNNTASSPGQPSEPPPAPNGAMFNGAQPWTLDVSGAPKSERSDAIIGALTAAGGWGTENRLQIDFSNAVFFADGSTPRMQVVGTEDYCFGGPACDAVPAEMPVPENANIGGSPDLQCDPSGNTEGQGDCQLLVVDRDSQRLYETYQSTKDGENIRAQGFFIWDLNKQYPDNLRGDQCTSADAGGFPIAAMTPTADQVASGSIDHAIRFILPNDRIRAGVYVHPASHAGGPESTDPNAPPFGVRLRLKADFDESGYTDPQKVVIKALKTHGMLLADGGQVPLTFSDDRSSSAKWADLGIASDTFSAITPEAFEVVELGPDVPLTYDCVRNP
ncbi:serine/threonine-protein kinase [Mycolicibacterium gadium]|uniref:non-specific serine/threonine protein kinase n=1 Tax=Mycolicibacterium gadium TaxID=1794 RepID=A0ABT6GLX6_MYCGU|nr:serine/threonine-protein kinase [Mycolicibacterium gadium]MDG5482307.1 serine/threonine protein kinase [Mycolicibacterium gadium]